MPGIEISLTALGPQLKAVHDIVLTTLSQLTGQRGWLLTSRIKTAASTIDKMETGRYQSLTELDDLVAFSIIIDTRSQQREALAFVRQRFNVSAVRGKSTLTDERIFDFDATRVYATLQLSISDSPLRAIVFEIQIRTILQHAWSKITHPLVYKSSHLDPRKIRLASEILANFEALDRSLSTFSSTSRSVKSVNKLRSSQLNDIIEMIDDLVEIGIIPHLSRPLNGRRFAENVLSSMDLRGRDFRHALSIIRAFLTDQAPNFPLSVSLYQLSIVALHRTGFLNVGSGRRPRYTYITPELVTLYPDVAQVRNAVRL